MQESPELDPLIHAQTRLRMLVALCTVPADHRVTFSWLREVVQMTPGNLSIHLRKLEEAEYVEIVKAFEVRTPTTYISLTERGRRAFAAYTAALREMLARVDETGQPVTNTEDA